MMAVISERIGVGDSLIVVCLSSRSTSTSLKGMKKLPLRNLNLHFLCYHVCFLSIGTVFKTHDSTPPINGA